MPKLRARNWVYSCCSSEFRELLPTLLRRELARALHDSALLLAVAKCPAIPCPGVVLSRCEGPARGDTGVRDSANAHDGPIIIPSFGENWPPCELRPPPLSPSRPSSRISRATHVPLEANPRPPIQQRRRVRRKSDARATRSLHVWDGSPQSAVRLLQRIFLVPWP